MKKKLLIIAMVAITAALGLSSCKKLKEAIFKAFITNTASVDFNVKIITTTNLRTDAGTISQKVNLDSIIKAETSDAFSLNDITSINMEEAKITILNADPDNNFANLEEGWLTFSTNTSPTPIQVATGINPDVFADSWLIPVDKTVNLKDYLKGTELAYVFAAKARKVTTKVLNCKLEIKFKIN